MWEDNRVLIRFRRSGTHQGEYFAMSTTNRVVRGWGMVIDRFVGEKLKSTRMLMNTLSIMQPLGVVPVAPESGSNPHAALS